MSINWKQTILGEVIEKANTGADAIKRAPIVHSDTGIKCLRIQDISQSKSYELWGNTEVTEKVYKNFKLDRGDILIARTGASIGCNFFIKDDFKSVFNNGLIRLKINKKAISEFVAYIINSNYFNRFIESISQGTSTQPNIQINAVLSLPILLPPLLEQKSIANTLSSFDDKIELLRE